MITWTDTAKEELENYFNRIRPGLEASGADASEVIEDIRRHIEQEAAAALSTACTWTGSVGFANRVRPEQNP